MSVFPMRKNFDDNSRCLVFLVFVILLLFFTQYAKAQQPICSTSELEAFRIFRQEFIACVQQSGSSGSVACLQTIEVKLKETVSPQCLMALSANGRAATSDPDRENFAPGVGACSSFGCYIDLTPVREYLKSADIPPRDAGAYGLVVFQYKATPANRAKLIMVCRSFIAFFPRSEASDVPPRDQMITIWPIDNPNAPEVIRDECNYIVDHYDLNAAEAAIRDAKHQHAVFSGEGPYLVGWSPSNARGVPDKFVLLVDMSNSNTQEAIDDQFLFWKQKIVEDPTLWRKGFSIERFRTAIRDFANEYGNDLLSSIKLFGGRSN